ncbi:hypothetical protein ES703_46097 [subsurface metagenome]
MRGGRKAELITPPTEARLSANPLLDMNHWGGRVELLRLREPWPRSRIMRKPTRSIVELLTTLIQRQATPRETATTVVMTRCPRLSNRFPMTPIVSPAASVPMEYIPETRDLLHPNSEIYESMNVETL